MDRKRIAGIAAVALIVLLLAGKAFGKIQASHEYLITKYYRFENLEDEEIVQYFTPEYNYLDAVELFIANISSETNGHICISITDEKGKEIFRKKYRVSKIPTGEFHTYKIGKKIKVGETYALCVSYEGDTEELPQIMVSEINKNLVETKDMYVHGLESEYNIAVSYHYSEKALSGILK